MVLNKEELRLAVNVVTSTFEAGRTLDEENNIKYKFPEMIFHYIEKHGYQPPKDFILFILKMPEMSIAENNNG